MFMLQTSSPRQSLDKVCFLQDMSGIVYTTVDFTAHLRPIQVYANLRMQQAGSPDSTWSAEPDGTVEYSTLAIHQ